MPEQTINTQGGAAVGGNVTTGGDFAGRDLHKHIHYHSAAYKEGMLYVGVPPMPQHFLGREALLKELVDRLCAGQTTVLSADGLPGVGKTTLAVALARHPRILEHFSDGVLWAGLGRTPDVASIQATWAEALGAEIRDLLDPYARQGRINNALGARRLLLVLDDVWQWEAAQQLRCSAPHSVTVLTTRDQGIARRFAGPQQSINVPVLAAAPGYALLYALAPEACDSDPVAAQRLAAQVDGLALALELLGGYLGASSQRRTQARRQQALAALDDPATRLALATQRLGDGQHREVTLRETMALSLADLPAAAVAAFHALGAFAPKPARFDLPAALAVTQTDEETLFTLADRNLVELAADETLALHQTLADLARTHLPPEATNRHRDHYLALVNEDQGDWQRIEAIYEQVSFAWTKLSVMDADAVHFVDHLSTFQTRRGLWQDRLSWLALALASAQQTQNQKDEARMFHEYGYVYSALGEKAKALGYYEQALPLSRQVGDKRGEATTLNNIGGVYDALGEKAKALGYYEQALPLSRQVGDKSGEATTLNNIGRVYDALGEKAKALGYYEQALPLWRQVGDKRGEATTLNNLGSVYDDLGEKAKALGYYEQALPLRRQVGDKSGEATTLNNLGRVYDALGEKAKALGYYEQALPLRRQVGDKRGEASTLNNIGGVYDALGEKAKALGYYEQALPLSRQVGDKRGEATTLNNIGGVYDALGEKAKALGYYEQALPLSRQVGDKRGEATTLNNIGRVYDALGEKAKALGYYEQALPLWRQVGDKRGEASTLNNLGSVYDDLGEKAKALGYYEQALPLRRQVGDKSGEATTLNNLGRVYDDLGEKAKALGYYEQALPLSRQVGDKSGEATTLNNLAVLSYYAGDFARSAEMFEAILVITEQIGAVADTANILFNLAVVYHVKLQRTQEAIALLQRSVALLEQKFPLHDGFGRTLADHQAYLAQLTGGMSAVSNVAARTTGMPGWLAALVNRLKR